MSYDYSKLRGRIVEKFGTLGAFSRAMGWSERTNGLKLNGAVEWNQSEIVKACDTTQRYVYKVIKEHVEGKNKK